MNGVGFGGLERGAAGVVEGRMEAMLPEWCRELMLTHQRDENAAAARRLLGVRDLVDTRCAMLQRSGTSAGRARRTALSEVAAASTCTMHMAEVHYGIAALLQLHLTAVRDAALAGLIDYAHLAVLYHGFAQVDPDIIEALDEEIAASARLLAPGALTLEVERLLMERDPRMAERLHARERSRRRVTVARRTSGMADVRAYLAADEAVVVDEAIDALASSVCATDPRDRATRRADAVVAMALGADRLECRCGRPECKEARRPDPCVGPAESVRSEVAPADRDAACDAEPASPTPESTGDVATAGGRVGAQRRVHVYVHVDLATLAHLTDTPGHLEGYGPICAEYARMLSESATWQLVFAEAKHLAEHWLAHNPQPGCGGGRNPSDAGGRAADRSDGGEDRLEGAGGQDRVDQDGGDEPDDGSYDPELEDPEYIAFIEAAYERWQAKENRLQREIDSMGERTLPATAGAAAGLPRPAPSTPLRHARIPALRTVPVIGDGRLIDTIRWRVAACRGMGSGIHPDGHGGYSTPPPGALTYKPARGIAREVRTRDGHCRHPGCVVPARRCEIDHVVPFDHDAPERGGWTVPQNLHCLCKMHHQLKTWRLWDVAVLAGYAECWSSNVTGQWLISVPGGFRTRPVPADDEMEPESDPGHGPGGRAAVSAEDIAFGAADPDADPSEDLPF
ncbi:HNH endonuclease signature motif containing protein [Tomitella gaofuii]|uniref:HNH endonuclease signature motif containing protein n=1 Tax=Tomitella gaofuii TaxID=2760083 RepID=UPI0015F983C8|nr:HNH endonuclease signature motif containing protein [Tomitella gaofuii]